MCSISQKGCFAESAVQKRYKKYQRAARHYAENSRDKTEIKQFLLLQLTVEQSPLGTSSARLNRIVNIALSRSLGRSFGSYERYIDQMLAQKPHLKLVRAQHFADQKIIGAIVTKFYSPPCQLTSLTNNDLVRIEQA